MTRPRAKHRPLADAASDHAAACRRIAAEARAAGDLARAREAEAAAGAYEDVAGWHERRGGEPPDGGDLVWFNFGVTT